MSLTISDFSLFFMKKMHPPPSMKKVTPLSKLRSCQAPPLSKNLVGGSIPHPKRGAHTMLDQSKVVIKISWVRLSPQKWSKVVGGTAKLQIKTSPRFSLQLSLSSPVTLSVLHWASYWKKVTWFKIHRILLILSI